VLYGSACDSRWHECGHGTAFRTGWMNDVVYHIASFQVMRNPVAWRWSHVRHHTDTYIVGRDAEIAWMHPARLLLKGLAYVGVVDAWTSLKLLAQQAHGPGHADLRPRLHPALGGPRPSSGRACTWRSTGATALVRRWAC
jgi:fatty acid desaturase